MRLQDVLGFSSGEAISKAAAALLIAALAMTAVQASMLRHSARTPEMLLGIGTFLAALSMLLCAYARTYPEISGVFALFGISLGLILPANLASLSLRVGSRAQGKAAGINVVGQGLGLAAGPLTGAGLYQISQQLPFLVAASLLALACVLALFAWRSARGLLRGETS
ncbi:MFS transporter [Shinella sp.]|uniref:MFS transporter n=1 Tax=Shinella sp. TaxID=1870904 RepID=UPI003F6F98CC